MTVNTLLKSDRVAPGHSNISSLYVSRFESIELMYFANRCFANFVIGEDINT